MTTARGRRPENAGAEECTRVRWFSPPALRLHAALLAGLALAGTATWLEWTRAHGGHTVAWVYTFEWPLLAVLGVGLWWRLLHPGSRPPSAGSGSRQQVETESDPELLAWQAYLTRLHEADPPGGPPER